MAEKPQYGMYGTMGPYQEFFEQGVGDETFGSRMAGTLTKGKLFEAPSSGFGSEYDADNIPIIQNLDPLSKAVYNTLAPYGEKAFDILDTIYRFPGAAIADIAQMAGVNEDDVNEIQAAVNTGIGMVIPKGNPIMTSAATNQAVGSVVKATNAIKETGKNVVGTPIKAITTGDSGFRLSAGPSKSTLENPFFGSFYKDTKPLSMEERKANLKKLMTSSDDVKKANKIPYETVEDQIALLDKKKLKQDKLREIKFNRLKNFERKDPFGLYTRQQLGSKEMEKLSKNPRIRSIFKDGKNQLIKGHALEPNAASVIPEAKGMKDFSIYETIPEKLLENLVMKKSPDVRRPQFFTTTKGNKIHEKLGTSLIKDLVEKYRIQGYVFKPNKNKKGGEWIFDKKIIPNNKIEKIKDINKSINYKESKLKELKLQTMFYNPEKKRLVFFGEGPTSLTDLKKAMTKRGFNQGGMVGISHLTRPLRNF